MVSKKSLPALIESGKKTEVAIAIDSGIKKLDELVRVTSDKEISDLAKDLKRNLNYLKKSALSNAERGKKADLKKIRLLNSGLIFDKFMIFILVILIILFSAIVTVNLLGRYYSSIHENARYLLALSTVVAIASSLLLAPRIYRRAQTKEEREETSRLLEIAGKDAEKSARALAK